MLLLVEPFDACEDVVVDDADDPPAPSVSEEQPDAAATPPNAAKTATKRREDDLIRKTSCELTCARVRTPGAYRIDEIRGGGGEGEKATRNIVNIHIRSIELLPQRVRE